VAHPADAFGDIFLDEGMAFGDIFLDEGMVNLVK
jgi:hypothetical protein